MLGRVDLSLVILGLALAVTGAVAGSPAPPSQVHIAFRGLDFDMVVSYWTPIQTQTSTVQFGTSASALSQSANGTSESYYVGFHHHVVLEGLLADTTYYYQCGDAEGGWSEVYSFNTAPKPTVNAAFTIGVIGDYGITNSENTTARLVERVDEVDWYFHIGDFAYADDRLNSSDFDTIWNEWQDFVQPLASGKAYMVGPGNHEATCHSFGDFFCPQQLLNFTAYNNRFRMPGVESGSNTNMWHSFDYGNAHFIMIDTETDYPNSPEGRDTIFKAGGFGNQLSWLEADLAKAAANRKERPWIIAGGHRPLYTASKRGIDSIIWPNVTGHLRAAVEDLFHQYDVDLYICGHVHAYERLYPVYRGQTQHSYVNPSFLPQLIVGCAGNIEGHDNSWESPLPEWTATVIGDHYGFGQLQFFNSTTLQWNFIASDTNEILDSFTLVKDSH